MRHQLDDQSCRASLLSLSPVSRSDPPSSVWRLPVALLHLGSSTATPSCWCVCSSSPYPPSCERRPCTTAVALLATNTTTLSARHLSEELLSQNFPQKRETKRKKKTLHRRTSSSSSNAQYLLTHFTRPLRPSLYHLKAAKFNGTSSAALRSAARKQTKENLR